MTSEVSSGVDAAPGEQNDEDKPKESPSMSDMMEDDTYGGWAYMPDSVLLMIFQYLSPRELLTSGDTCKSWNRVSQDEMLWKKLFYRTYKIDPLVGIMPGMKFK